MSSSGIGQIPTEDVKGPKQEDDLLLGRKRWLRGGKGRFGRCGGIDRFVVHVRRVGRNGSGCYFSARSALLGSRDLSVACALSTKGAHPVDTGSACNPKPSLEGPILKIGMPCFDAISVTTARVSSDIRCPRNPPDGFGMRISHPATLSPTVSTMRHSRSYAQYGAL